MSDGILLAEVERQMKWYSKKCGQYKRSDVALQILVMAFSAAIPVLIVFDFEGNKYYVAAISTLVAFFSGLRNVMRYKEKWILYRDTLETLKREKLAYAISIGAYADQENKLQTLAHRYMEITGDENTGWQSEASIQADLKIAKGA